MFDGKYERCATCKEWGWSGNHVCDPTWLVIRAEHDDEDEPSKVYSDTSENAALKYAEDRFSDWEYPKDIEIWARKTEDDEWEKFEITVEAVPSFSASRKV